MQILGIRTAPNTIRYAILEWDVQTPTFVNEDSENKLDIPANFKAIEQKLRWLYDELERILRQYSNIKRIVIKTNEYGRGGEKASSRDAAYLDGVILLFAEQNKISVETKLYRKIGTKRDEVKAFAESKAGVSTCYWNEQMADAVAAAWSGKGD